MPKCPSQSRVESEDPCGHRQQPKPARCKCGQSRYIYSQICSCASFHKHKFVLRLAKSGSRESIVWLLQLQVTLLRHEKLRSDEMRWPRTHKLYTCMLSSDHTAATSALLSYKTHHFFSCAVDTSCRFWITFLSSIFCYKESFKNSTPSWSQSGNIYYTSTHTQSIKHLVQTFIVDTHNHPTCYL